MTQALRSALGLLTVLTVITGIAYPLAITLASGLLMPAASSGSLIKVGDRVVGSEWIGQTFHSPGYFWGRPSATSQEPYNAAASSGSNLGPTNPALGRRVLERAKALRAQTPDPTASVPVDLVTASASGLDPHISRAAAYYQLARVGRARGLSEARLRSLVDRYVEPKTLGILGEDRVHVLRLNLALDRLAPLSSLGAR